MAAIVTAHPRSHRRPLPARASSVRVAERHGPVAPRAIAIVAIAAGFAWLLAVLAQATGTAALLHHHALIDGGPPIWLALPIFLLAWQVMIAAMMLPASLPAIRAFESRSAARGMPVFLVAYAVVWTVFGVAAFLGDMALHGFVHATPWLAVRPWLIEAGLLAVAGAYQLTPVKRQGLSACRHPAADAGRSVNTEGDAIRSGLEHGLDCVVSSWALMLLMFGAGVANLGWMAILTVGMTYEALGQRGLRVSAVFGILLLGLAGWVAVTGSLPGFGAT